MAESLNLFCRVPRCVTTLVVSAVFEWFLMTFDDNRAHLHTIRRMCTRSIVSSRNVANLLFILANYDVPNLRYDEPCQTCQLALCSRISRDCTLIGLSHWTRAWLVISQSVLVISRWNEASRLVLNHRSSWCIARRVNFLATSCALTSYRDVETRREIAVEHAKSLIRAEFKPDAT